MPTITPQTPAVVGNAMSLLCQSKSNAVPVYHNLILYYSWRINNSVIVQSHSRYKVNNNDLSIYPLDISDNFNRYTCTTREETGPTSDPAVHNVDLICKMYSS